MAQTEDTELRDLVIEALEKNGSLAKIRALLRANIFLAFEDECENMRHNMSLDSILKVPEGICALSIVHEFLEFCNLKNTLFVYKSESRQGKDYKHDGKKYLYDKLNFNKLENAKEPVLITLIKTVLKLNYNNHGDNSSILNKLRNCGDNTYKDDHNSSYIVHEDSQSSATSTSQSDNSLEDKNKLHLRLHLDNSDTDTSTDSSKGKSASEYILSDHIIATQDSNNSPRDVSVKVDTSPHKQHLSLPNYFTKVAGNTSSESTSYIDLKPFSSIDEKMLNTSGLPTTDQNDHINEEISKNLKDNKSNSSKSATLSNMSSMSIKNDNQKESIVNKPSQESTKSDGDTAEYSYDFSVSQVSRNKENSDKRISPDSPKNFAKEMNRSSPVTSPYMNSHSSVSISDVADLLSDKSLSFEKQSNSEKSPNILSNSSKKKSAHLSNKLNSSDNSGDFTESPVPSLSNLSLDIHSD